MGLDADLDGGIGVVVGEPDVVVHEANSEAQIAPAVDTAARLAYGSYQSVAVLISQAVIGIKSFQDQAAR